MSCTYTIKTHKNVRMESGEECSKKIRGLCLHHQKIVITERDSVTRWIFVWKV
jgi:hypothetical protein